MTDYTNIINQFGAQPIDSNILQRIETITSKPAHPFLRRGVFFSHRSLDDALTSYEKGTPFYLYTGRGPSSDGLHIGHLIPFLFTKYLQDTFKVPLVVQMTDDEKFLFRDLTMLQVRTMMIDNIKDIIATGLDPERTFIFSNIDYMGSLYPNVVQIEKCVTTNQIKSIFGFTDSDNIGRISFPAIQAAPSFSSSFPGVLPQDKKMPCLIPCGVDQDPFFRMTRDVAPRLGYLKPAVLHSKFFPAVTGIDKKMSSSDPNTAIFLTDTSAQIEDKITKHAFSGGRVTLKEHREKGADLDVDVAYQYIRIFSSDDALVDRITKEYGGGTMGTRDVKREAIRILTELVTGHQKRRALVTDDDVKTFMKVRPILTH